MPGGVTDVTSLHAEVQRLRQKVFEMEEALRKERALGKEKEKQHSTQLLGLLRQKDDKLGDYAEELEEKNRKLEGFVKELERKNEELQMWISSLRLYQDIFEHEAALMIGVNAEGRVVLFNKAVTDHFGAGFPEYLFQDVEALNFDVFGPGVAALVREALAARQLRERDGPAAKLWVFPIVSADVLRGALLKIARKG